MSTAEAQEVYVGRVGFYSDEISPCLLDASGPTFEPGKELVKGDLMVFRFVAPDNGFITALQVSRMDDKWHGTLLHDVDAVKRTILKGEVFSFACEKP